MMVFLDTHVVLWLYAEPERIPESVAKRIDEADLFVSPMVRLEMSLLAEIDRIRDEPDSILGLLHRDLDLVVEESGWSRAAQIANHLSWTRDPFDRLITAHALAYGADLCTRDRAIREHYRHGFWD